MVCDPRLARASYRGPFRAALPVEPRLWKDPRGLAHEAGAFLAREQGCTMGQLALAWVLAKGSDLVPIPGTKRVSCVDDDMAAASVTLSAADVEALDAAFPPGAASGDRYNAAMASLVDRG